MSKGNCPAVNDANGNRYYCTLDAEHDGPHEAHGTSGTVWSEWLDDDTPTTPSPTTTPSSPAPAAVHLSLTIDVANTEPRFHCRHGDDRLSLRLTEDSADAWLYLDGTESDLIDFAWVILATLTMERGKADAETGV